MNSTIVRQTLLAILMVWAAIVTITFIESRTGAGAQTANRLYGTRSNGAPVPVGATDAGVLKVSCQ